MWLPISTRPDIANAVRAVARYCAAPRAIHWKAALGILEYINGTSEYGITFQRGTLSGISLEVFADADYASKATDRRSVSGGLIMCGGASVCRFSRTQNFVTLLTSEAEYVALGDAVKELFFVDKQETAHIIEEDVKLRFHNRFIYVGVDISIYALLTGGRS